MKILLETVLVFVIWLCIITPIVINFNQVKSNQNTIIQKLDSIQQECINIQNSRTTIHCNCNDEHQTDTITKYIYIK